MQIRYQRCYDSTSYKIGTSIAYTKNLKLTVCVQNIVTYEAFCKHNIRFFNVGLQPRLCATCRVYCVGSLVSAQSDKAEPDMSIALLNKPGKTKSITGCCLVNKTENMFAPLQQNYANSDFRGKLNVIIFSCTNGTLNSNN